MATKQNRKHQAEAMATLLTVRFDGAKVRRTDATECGFYGATLYVPAPETDGGELAISLYWDDEDDAGGWLVEGFDGDTADSSPAALRRAVAALRREARANRYI